MRPARSWMPGLPIVGQIPLTSTVADRCSLQRRVVSIPGPYRRTSTRQHVRASSLVNVRMEGISKSARQPPIKLTQVLARTQNHHTPYAEERLPFGWERTSQSGSSPTDATCLSRSYENTTMGGRSGNRWNSEGGIWTSSKILNVRQLKR